MLNQVEAESDRKHHISVTAATVKDLFPPPPTPSGLLHSDNGDKHLHSSSSINRPQCRILTWTTRRSSCCSEEEEEKGGRSSSSSSCSAAGDNTTLQQQVNPPQQQRHQTSNVECLIRSSGLYLWEETFQVQNVCVAPPKAENEGEDSDEPRTNGVYKMIFEVIETYPNEAVLGRFIFEFDPETLERETTSSSSSSSSPQQPSASSSSMPTPKSVWMPLEDPTTGEPTGAELLVRVQAFGFIKREINNKKKLQQLSSNQSEERNKLWRLSNLDSFSATVAGSADDDDDDDGKGDQGITTEQDQGDDTSQETCSKGETRNVSTTTTSIDSPLKITSVERSLKIIILPVGKPDLEKCVIDGGGGGDKFSNKTKESNDEGKKEKTQDDGDLDDYSSDDESPMLSLPNLEVIEACSLSNCLSLSQISLKGLPKLHTIGRDFAAFSQQVATVRLVDLPFLERLPPKFLSESPSLRALTILQTPKMKHIQEHFCSKCHNLDSLNLKGLSEVERIDSYFLSGSCYAAEAEVETPSENDNSSSGSLKLLDLCSWTKIKEVSLEGFLFLSLPESAEGQKKKGQEETKALPQDSSSKKKGGDEEGDGNKAGDDSKVVDTAVPHSNDPEHLPCQDKSKEAKSKETKKMTVTTTILHPLPTGFKFSKELQTLIESGGKKENNKKDKSSSDGGCAVM